MFDRFSRSWSLVKASASVLRADKELLLFPVMSSIAAIIVAASFIAPMFGLGLISSDMEQGMSPAMWAVVFVFYCVQYFVIFFFNTALVGAAMIRLDGGDPTVADGLRIAWQRVGRIFGYAVIAATVGMILRAIEERAGFLGRIVVGLIGLAWTLATFLVVPVLVTRDVGPIEAVKQSAVLLKRTWGENLIGNVGIGLVFGLLTFALVLTGVAATVAAAAVGWQLALMVGAIAVVAVLAMAAVQAALTGIYSAALYRWIDSGEAPNGFDGELLQGAFRVK